MKHALLALALVGCVKTQVDERDAGAAAAAPPTVATAPAGLGVDQCEKILVGAERALSEARAAASTDCKTKEDCALVFTGACVGSCPVHPMAKTSEPAYGSTLARIRATSCKEWNEGGCPKTTPKPTPTCRPFEVQCKAGKCSATGS